MKLFIDEENQNVIFDHAIQTYPNESCGFLFGSDDRKRIVHFVMPVENKATENQKRRFSISPQDYQRAEMYALKSGLKLLGVYHSHPDHPAIPSEHDLKQALPYFSYVITSLYNQKIMDIKSWRLDDFNLFNEENVETISSDSLELI